MKFCEKMDSFVLYNDIPYFHSMSFACFCQCRGCMEYEELTNLAETILDETIGDYRLVASREFGHYDDDGEDLQVRSRTHLCLGGSLCHAVGDDGTMYLSGYYTQDLLLCP